MKTPIIQLFGFLTLIFSVLIQAAEFKIEIIPLQYRNATEVISVIKPLLGEGETVTGINDQLILKARPSNISDIKLLLEKIDRKPRRLMITVTNEITKGSQGKEHSVTGSYGSGDVSISVGQPGEDGKGTGISVAGKDNNRLDYRIDDSHSSSQENSNFQLQALEGQPAFIDTGLLIPVRGRTAYVTGGGIVVQENIEYRDATSGFYVVPNLNGDLVTLLISPYMTRVTPGRIESFDVQSAETTVQGHLGEWIEIGGIDQQSYRENSGILYNKGRRSSTAHSIIIKVEELN